MQCWGKLRIFVGVEQREEEIEEPRTDGRSNRAILLLVAGCVPPLHFPNHKSKMFLGSCNTENVGIRIKRGVQYSQRVRR